MDKERSSSLPIVRQNATTLKFEHHFENLNNKNSRYFNHLEGYFISFSHISQGRCPCGVCICGGHRCQETGLQQDYKKEFQSIYQQEFKKINFSDTKPLFSPQLWQNFQSKLPIDFSTTNRTDYCQQKIVGIPLGKEERTQPLGHIPFSSISMNSCFLLNWGVNKASKLQPGTHPTVVKNLQCDSKTVYRKDYTEQIIDRENEKKTNQMLNNAKNPHFTLPIFSDIPFLGETSSIAAYRPFKTFKYAAIKPMISQSIKYPAYEGQYKTIKQLNYDDKGKKYCPASEMIRSQSTKGIIQS